MAKYELPEFQSVYRDTGAVQVNQLKRQEYLANMQADNALSTSVMNMDALAKDQDKLETIAEKYNTNINQRSERKDYENLGMSINKDAMSFVKDYSPIKRQVDIRAGYKTKLDEDVKAKRINQNTANLLLAESDYKYKGVEITPAGTVNRDSFYKGSGVVNDVDVMALMQDEMKDYAVRKGKQEGFKLLNEDFNVIKEEKDGEVKYKYETTTGFEEIHPDDVAMIANKVLTRPEVIASMEQEARLGTFTSGEIADGQVKSEATNAIEENISLSRKKLSEAKKELKEKDLTADEKQTIEKKIVNLQKSIDFETDYLKSGKNPVDYYKAIKFNEIAEAHADYFISKYSYKNVEVKEDIKKFEAGEGANEFNKHVSDTVIYLQASEDLANTVSGGITIESILKTKSDNAAILTSIEEEFASSPGIVNTLTNISNEKEILELSKTLKDNNGNLLDISAVRNKVAQAKRAQDNIRLLERRTKEAVASVFGDMVLPNGEIDQTKYTAYVNNRYNNEMQNPAKGRYTQSTEEASGPNADLYDGAAILETFSYRDIRDAAIKAGLVPEGSDTKTVLDLLRDSEVVEGVPNPLDDDQKPTEIPSVANAIIDNIEGLTTGEGETPLWAAQDFINVVKQNYGKYELDNDKEVQKHLDNNEINISYVLSTNYGDPTATTREGVNKTIKGGLVEDTVVYAKGNSEPINFHEWAKENGLVKTDKEGDIKKLLDEGFDIVPEKSGLITVANQTGEPMIAVGIKIKKTGQTKMVYMPAGQIDVFYKGKSPMREYINSTGFKLERLFNNGASYNVESDTPNLPGGLQVRFNYSNTERPIEITFGDGDKAQTVTYPKTEGLNYLETLLGPDKLNVEHLLH